MDEEKENIVFKIEGLEKLARDLDEAQKALASIDGEIGQVRFEPDDPASIEKAIQDMEMMIDARVSKYSSNPIVGPMIDEMKEKYRQAILDKAAEARLEAGDDSETERASEGE